LILSPEFHIFIGSIFPSLTVMKKISLVSLIVLFSSLFSSGQWTYSNLSEAKAYLGAAVLGTKAYFAGGYNEINSLSKVEIYDARTGTWDTTFDLSVPRELTAGVSCGSKVFFAGGIDLYGTMTVYSTVDIFDTLTQQWTVEQLSVPRVCIAAVSKGSKVLFAGGVIATPYVCADVVDIYDIETGIWTAVNLSEPRDARMAAVVEDLAFFAGGYNGSVVTKRVDIYNFTTGIWSIDSLSVARDRMTVTTVGSKILFAGGMTSNNQRSDVVDIYGFGKL
jgi:hypothetical protein